MNRSITNVAFVVATLFALLFGALTYVQFFQSDRLNADSRNSRALYKEFGQDRGALLVEGTPVAMSVPSNDAFSFQRTYPQGPLYAPLTGFYSLVYGSTELESVMNGQLSGTSDSLAYSKILRAITGSQPKGASVELTINPRLQAKAYELLGNQKGSVVMLDPKTGNILAMVSTPSYDPNLIASHDGQTVREAYNQLVADPSHPLFNRAIAGELYAPGSTFKVLVAAAAVESGKYTLDSPVEGRAEAVIPGTNTSLPNYARNSCGNAGADRVSLKTALAFSCNTAFAEVGVELGQDYLKQMAEKFQFGKKISIPLPVTPGVFPDNEDNAQLGTSSIGQFNVRMSPLQISLMTAAIANKGVMMKPNLIKNVRASDLKIVEEPAPEELARPVSEGTAAQVVEMMKAGVSEGVANGAALPNVAVAGKTGTAEQGVGEKNDSLFTGFAPADDPQVVVSVVVEDGGNAGDEATGAVVAVPIAHELLKEVFTP